MFRFVLSLFCYCLLSSSAFANNQKTILVTGVTGELGWAIAQTLASEKYNLVLVGRNPEKLNQRITQLTKAYPNNTFSQQVNTICPTTPIPMSFDLPGLGSLKI